MGGRCVHPSREPGPCCSTLHPRPSRTHAWFWRVCWQDVHWLSSPSTTQPSGQSRTLEKAACWPCDLGRVANLSGLHLPDRGQCPPLSWDDA